MSDQKNHILIAEDNPTNQVLAAAILKRLGYTSDVVNNGREAVEAIQKKHYDLILMDCNMPELDGYQATVQIRESEKKTGLHMPIIAITANTMEESREQCLLVGMDDLISKPIKRELLENTLKKAILSSSKTQSISDRAA